jgi:hypothetical protein
MKALLVTAVVVSVTMAIFAVLLEQQIRKVSSWPTVSGVVISSALRHTLVDDANRTRHLALVPEITYEFAVNGRRIRGSGVSTRKYVQDVTSMTSTAGDDLNTLMTRYRAGTIVTVHYDPLHPESSLLEIDRSGVVICGVISGLGALAAIAAHRFR